MKHSKGTKRMKVDRKRLEESFDYIDLINKQPLKRLDLSDWCVEIPEHVLDEFQLSGLHNTDFIYSSYSTKWRKLK
jgi:hypothetical protein